MRYYHAIEGLNDNLERYSEIETSSSPAKANTSLCSLYGRRIHGTDKCITSKTALLTLFWSSIVSLTVGFPNQFIVLRGVYGYDMKYLFLAYATMTVFHFFYPLAGFLADIKYGRYKMIFRSLYCLSAC